MRNPSGSRKTWCRSLPSKRTTLSSMEGQYRGPIPLITPEYRGERESPDRIASWVAALVYVM